MKYIKSFRANNIADLEEDEIREKEFMHQCTEFDEAGHPVEAITYNPDGTIEHTYKYQYNSDGKLEHELLFEGDGELTQHRSMEYNADGQIIKESTHYLDGTADELLYTYDKEGRLVSRRSIDSEGETGNYLVNVYEGENLVSETEYDISGEIITQRRVIYEDGKMTGEVFITPEENFEIVYSYDEEGVQSVRRRYSDDKNLMERNTYTYDSEGRISESMEETSSGIEINYTTYDEAGNVILQEEKSEDGELLSSIERTYDELNRNLTTSVVLQRPGQQVPQHYRIRTVYE
jgi:YD repeat-containing protein